MRTVFVLLVFFHVASTVKHSLEYLFTSSNRLWEFPEFVGALVVDGVQFSYWDSNSKTAKTDNWTREFMRDNPDHLQWYSSQCLNNQHDFRTLMGSIRQHLDQSEGVHILQMRGGCEWDEDTGETASFMTYGYDGDDFIALDPQLLTWVALNPKALPTKLKWDTYKNRLRYIKTFYIDDCPIRLKNYVPYMRKVIQRTVLPSVSLLQKSPSSPVRCFATGFYPDRAVMFWRKDGEELHEGVDHGEILPNHDDTYQMSADLNILSMKSRDWRKYECVFQLYGVEEGIVTRLDQSPLTNFISYYRRYVSAGVAAAAAVVLLIGCLIRFLIQKNKKRESMLASVKDELLSLQPLHSPNSSLTSYRNRTRTTTFIIGDSMANRVKLENAITRGFPGATIPKIQRKLQVFLPLLPPSVKNIVLLAGTDNITSGKCKPIKWHFDSLFRVLKRTKKTIFIIGIIPIVDYDVKDVDKCLKNLRYFNDCLRSISTTHRFIFIDGLEIYRRLISPSRPYRIIPGRRGSIELSESISNAINSPRHV